MAVVPGPTGVGASIVGAGAGAASPEYLSSGKLPVACAKFEIAVPRFASACTFCCRAVARLSKAVTSSTYEFNPFKYPRWIALYASNCAATCDVVESTCRCAL